jgi:hypothetical protein
VEALRWAAKNNGRFARNLMERMSNSFTNLEYKKGCSVLKNNSENAGK